MNRPRNVLYMPSPWKIRTSGISATVGASISRRRSREQTVRRRHGQLVRPNAAHALISSVVAVETSVTIDADEHVSARRPASTPPRSSPVQRVGRANGSVETSLLDLRAVQHHPQQRVEDHDQEDTSRIRPHQEPWTTAGETDQVTIRPFFVGRSTAGRWRARIVMTNTAVAIAAAYPKSLLMKPAW